jgi:magnesium-transporting ATPase (P-type)
MCTGDNLDTAIAIAVDANIISEAQAYSEDRHPFAFMTGEQFLQKIGGLTEVDDPDNEGKKKLGVQNMREFREVAS